MLPLLLALAAPDLSVVYEQAQAEVRRVPPPPISELLDAIRAAPNPSEQARLLKELVGRCGGLDSAESTLVVMSLEDLPGRPRVDLGRCAFWFRDAASYDRALRALIERPDVHSLLGLHEASKRLHVASLTTADAVYEVALDAARVSTSAQERLLAVRILYNVVTTRSAVLLDQPFEDLVFADMEHEQPELRFAMLRLIRVSWPRHPETLRFRQRARDLFLRLSHTDPDARIRILADRYLREIPA